MAQIPKKGNLSKTQKPAGKKTRAPEVVTLKPLPKNENLFIFSVLGAYLIIGLIGVFHHEMWRDELQVWLVGASSHSLGEFLRNMANECNPLGWYGTNFILSRFSQSPLIAQIFHFLLSAGTVFMILKYSPFSRLQKVLLPFSYYILFEYGLIARGYGLTIFFVFLFCVLYQQVKSKRRYLILSVPLFCLANTAGHGILLAISFCCMMVADYYFSEDVSIRKKYNPMQLFMAIAIVIIGIYISMKWITPPADNVYANNWFIHYDQERVRRTLRTFWMCFMPIPSMSTVNFWNTNYFYQANTGPFTFYFLTFLSLCVFIYCILFHSKKISVVVFYLAATCSILLFNYGNSIIYIIYGARYYGFIFISFAVGAWLSGDLRKSTFVIPWLNSLRDKLKAEKYFTYLVTALFAFNTLGGAIAYCKDYSLPFSNITATGKYIVNHNLAGLPETGFIDYAVSPVSAFTRQPIYFPDRDTIGRFTISTKSKESFDMNVLLSRITNYILHQKDSVVFISNGDFFGIGDEKVINTIQYSRIAKLYGAVVNDEDFNIYIARKFDVNKLMEDPAAYQNLQKVSSIVSAANDLMEKGKLDESGKILAAVEEKTNGMAVPHLHNYLGMLYSKENKPADAEKEFNTEIALNLEKEESFFNLGMLYFQDKDYDKAIIAWDSTVKIDPKNVDAFNNLGVCYLNFRKDNTQGMTYFEKAVELNPNYTQGYFNILVCAQNNSDEQTLIKYIRILLDKGVSINDIRAKNIQISDELLQKINSR